MIKKFIKAGTPGTFRPGHGEYPELGTRVDSWVLQGDKLVRFADEFAADINADFMPGKVVAWSYAPTPPPVDDFEAFNQGWGNGPDLIGGHGFRYYPADGLLVDGYNINPDERKLGTFPTLEEAQAAAYAHFLQSRNDSEQ